MDQLCVGDKVYCNSEDAVGVVSGFSEDGIPVVRFTEPPHLHSLHDAGMSQVFDEAGNSIHTPFPDGKMYRFCVEVKFIGKTT
jgi:hypothetical protein